jgi:hypothetical protein
MKCISANQFRPTGSRAVARLPRTPLGLLLCAVSTLPLAQTAGQRAWLHVGPAAVQFNSSATVDVPALGGRVPGQSARASNSTTLGVEIGYELWPNVMASATVGLPPTTTLTGRDSHLTAPS